MTSHSELFARLRVVTWDEMTLLPTDEKRQSFGLGSCNDLRITHAAREQIARCIAGTSTQAYAREAFRKSIEPIVGDRAYIDEKDRDPWGRRFDQALTRYTNLVASLHDAKLNAQLRAHKPHWKKRGSKSGCLGALVLMAVAYYFLRRS